MDKTRGRATSREKQVRLAQVRGWIVDDEPSFSELCRRIMEEWGIGRRQSIRYIVEARAAMLSDRERYMRQYGRSVRRRPDGRFERW